MIQELLLQRRQSSGHGLSGRSAAGLRPVRFPAAALLLSDSGAPEGQVAFQGRRQQHLPDADHAAPASVRGQADVPMRLVGTSRWSPHAPVHRGEPLAVCHSRDLRPRGHEVLRRPAIVVASRLVPLSARATASAGGCNIGAATASLPGASLRVVACAPSAAARRRTSRGVRQRLWRQRSRGAISPSEEVDALVRGAPLHTEGLAHSGADVVVQRGHAGAERVHELLPRVDAHLALP
mmetsp:Transcript_27948/g.80178  ORF Transcript_27948/g.80178 Transcript_27948/m.80178 type:complete len:237 (+) Transcript_27948:1893-2603(+)